jgi:hypothetical protein
MWHWIRRFISLKSYRSSSFSYVDTELLILPQGERSELELLAHKGELTKSECKRLDYLVQKLQANRRKGESESQ